MVYRLAADLLLLVHLLFIVFVVAGALLVWRRSWVAWLHLPAALWGALVELRGWYCPLTPAEQWMRQAAGEAGYSGGFIEHYLLPLIYPAPLGRDLQLLLGSLVIVVNLAAYGWLWGCHRRRI
jgi:hypothetical protein